MAVIEQNGAMAIRHWMRFAAVCGVMLVAVVASSWAETSAKQTAVVDVNRATVAELMTVPGMTEVWAKRIVRFRPYRRKTDLVDHGVISAEEYGKIRDYVVAHRVTEEGGKQANTQ